MKKYIPAVITAIVIAIPAIVLFVVFALPNLKYLLRDTREFSFDDATRVEIRSGFGMGFTATTETDPETVERLATRAVYGTFIKGEKLPEYTGYSYMLRYYTGDELIDTLTVLGNGRLDYDGYLYTGDAHDGAGVDTDYLDELLYTALPLDELLTYGTQFVDDLLHGYTREKIISLYGEPDSFAENGASLYRTDTLTLYINYTGDKVSSIWIAEHPLILRYEFEGVTRIELKRPGDTINVYDEDDIARIVSNLGSVEFHRGEELTQIYYGWNYALTFYGEDGEIAAIENISDTTVVHNGYRYALKEGAVDTAFYDALILREMLQ